MALGNSGKLLEGALNWRPQVDYHEAAYGNYEDEWGEYIPLECSFADLSQPVLGGNVCKAWSRNLKTYA